MRHFHTVLWMSIFAPSAIGKTFTTSVEKIIEQQLSAMISELELKMTLDLEDKSQTRYLNAERRRLNRILLKNQCKSEKRSA